MNEVDKIVNMAQTCVDLSREKRPEVTWIQGIYKRFQEKTGITEKNAADSLLYEKMYCSAPARPSDTLKIRYWRNGQHVPIDRYECRKRGLALGMSVEEEEFLIKGYLDKSDTIFGIFGEKSAKYEELWEKRKNLMSGMVLEYIKKIHPDRRIQLRIARNSMESGIRHLYYTDAMKYVNIKQRQMDLSENSHLASINYGSELGRNLHLEGEIPRKTMVRHILIFGMPYINRALVSERLDSLGYLPFDKDHTMTDGGRLDWLLLEFLGLYEETCQGMEPEECSQWFQEACRILDSFFMEKGFSNLRFMYFKALGE